MTFRLWTLLIINIYLSVDNLKLFWFYVQIMILWNMCKYRVNLTISDNSNNKIWDFIRSDDDIFTSGNEDDEDFIV